MVALCLAMMKPGVLPRGPDTEPRIGPFQDVPMAPPIVSTPSPCRPAQSQSHTKGAGLFSKIWKSEITGQVRQLDGSGNWVPPAQHRPGNYMAQAQHRPGHWVPPAQHHWWRSVQHCPNLFSIVQFCSILFITVQYCSAMYSTVCTAICTVRLSTFQTCSIL